MLSSRSLRCSFGRVSVSGHLTGAHPGKKSKALGTPLPSRAHDSTSRHGGSPPLHACGLGGHGAQPGGRAVLHGDPGTGDQRAAQGAAGRRCTCSDQDAPATVERRKEGLSLNCPAKAGTKNPALMRLGGGRHWQASDDRDPARTCESDSRRVK